MSETVRFVAIYLPSGVFGVLFNFPLIVGRRRGAISGLIGTQAVSIATDVLGSNADSGNFKRVTVQAVSTSYPVWAYGQRSACANHPLLGL